MKELLHIVKPHARNDRTAPNRACNAHGPQVERDRCIPMIELQIQRHLVCTRAV